MGEKRKPNFWTTSITVLLLLSLLGYGVFVLIESTQDCVELFAYELSRSVPEPQRNGITELEAPTFFERHLGCRSANELGDTLAGIFAPLAFIALVIALLLQRAELKAQLDEYKGSREAQSHSAKIAYDTALRDQLRHALLDLSDWMREQLPTVTMVFEEGTINIPLIRDRDLTPFAFSYFHKAFEFMVTALRPTLEGTKGTPSQELTKGAILYRPLLELQLGSKIASLGDLRARTIVLKQFLEPILKMVEEIEENLPGRQATNLNSADLLAALNWLNQNLPDLQLEPNRQPPDWLDGSIP